MFPRSYSHTSQEDVEKDEETNVEKKIEYAFIFEVN